MEDNKFIYCRAKSIMSKEEDVIALVNEVCELANDSKPSDESAQDWMIKQTYLLGCGKYRKKKAREAEVIELNEQEYAMQKGVDPEQTKRVICDTLAELPDLYHATLMAIYYDQYTVKQVAEVTGYSVGVVMNRLNYVHKYLSKKLEDHKAEHKVNVQFSVEMVYEALKQWAEPVAPKANLDAVKEELLAHSVKKGMNKQQVVVTAGIVVGLAVLSLIAILIIGSIDKQKDNPPKQQITDEDVDKEAEEDISMDSQEDVSEDSSEESKDVPNSEYILPNSDTVKLTKSDLQGLSKDQLRLARNEIFARYGMIFGNPELDAYFGEKSWYSPRVSYNDFYDTVEMNEIEEANLALILSVEEEME